MLPGLRASTNKPAGSEPLNGVVAIKGTIGSSTLAARNGRENIGRQARTTGSRPSGSQEDIQITEDHSKGRSGEARVGEKHAVREPHKKEKNVRHQTQRRQRVVKAPGGQTNH